MDEDGWNLIEKIAMEYSQSSDLIKGNLSGGVNLIKMTYGVAPHRQFVLEYLQNAIDAGAKRIVFQIYGDRIVVTNDGAPFNAHNVKSICGIAQSSKQPTAGFIGFIGIGAKSAFLLGERLEIHSGKFHFAFDSSIGVDKPWEILPQPIENCRLKECNFVQEGYNTSFILSKLNSDVVDSLHKVLLEPKNDYYMDARTLLFTPSDELSLEIVDFTKNIKRQIRRKTLESETNLINGKELNVTRILLEETNKKDSSEKWLVLTTNINIDLSVREDLFTRLYRRETVSERPISIAFLLDEEENLVSCQGVVKFGVFSFMPLREVESGLSFLIHADFITEPGRTTIASDAKWNLYFRSKIEEFILSDVCRYLKSNNRYKSQTLILVPSKIVEGFFGGLAENLRNRIREADVVLTYHGFKKPSESLVLPSYVYNLLSREDYNSDIDSIEALLSKIHDSYPTQFKINGDYYLVKDEVGKQIERLKITRDTLRGIKMFVLPLTHIITNDWRRKSISSLYDQILKRLKDVKDYAEMFEYLAKRELEDIKNNYRVFFSNLSILTESGETLQLKEVYALPYDKVRQSTSNPLLLTLVDKFGKKKLINQKLLSSFRSFVRNVGTQYGYVQRGYEVFSLEKELECDENSLKAFFDTLKIYVKREIETLVENMQLAIEKGNINDVKNIMYKLLEYYDTAKEYFNDERLKQKIRFKVENGSDFRLASELLLPHDSHNLKDIFEYIDGNITKGGPCLSKYLEIKKEVNFLDLAFYDNIEKEKLRNFIMDLGGGSLSPDVKKRIVEAVGMQLVAIREWRMTGVEIREVEGRTHDLEVMGDNTYYIEVKSTHSTAEEFEVELRGGQIDALKSERNTRLYIVTEALTNPKLILPKNELIINSIQGASVKIKVKELIDPSTVRENLLLSGIEEF